MSDIFLSSSSCSDDDDEKKTPQKMIMSDNLLEPEKEKRSQRKTKTVDTFSNVSTYLFTIQLSQLLRYSNLIVIYFSVIQLFL